MKKYCTCEKSHFDMTFCCAEKRVQIIWFRKFMRVIMNVTPIRRPILLETSTPIRRSILLEFVLCSVGPEEWKYQISRYFGHFLFVLYFCYVLAFPTNISGILAIFPAIRPVFPVICPFSCNHNSGKKRFLVELPAFFGTSIP